MVVKTIAPYGSWESPFSVDDATAGSKALSSPRGDVRNPNPASHLSPSPDKQTTTKLTGTPHRSAPGASSSSSPRRTAPTPSSRW